MTRVLSFKFRTVARVLLFLALPLLFLVGCEKENKSDLKELEFMLSGKPSELKVLRKQIDRFEAENPGIKVHLLHVPGSGKEYEQKFLTMAAAGTPADLAMVFTMIYYTYIQRGTLLDLTSMIEEDPDFRKEDYFETNWEGLEYHGAYYGVPLMWITYVLYYNKQIFDKEGVKYPYDGMRWDEFVDVAKRLVHRDSDGRILQYAFVWPDFYMKESLWYLLLHQNGGRALLRDGDEYVLGKEPYVRANTEALRYFIDLSEKHHISPASYELEQFQGMDLFLEGKAAMKLSGSWEPFVFRERKFFEWGVTSLPFSTNPYTFHSSTMLVVPKGAKHPKEAFKLAKYLSCGEHQNILAETGRAIPSLISATQTDFYKKSFEVDRDIMIQVAKSGGRSGYKGKSAMYRSEIYDIEKRNLELVFLHQISLEEAIQRIQQRVENVLSKER